MDGNAAGTAGSTGSEGEGIADPRFWRERIRSKEFRGHTSGVCPGFAQANVLVLPVGFADAFEEFCHRNPQACPLLERLPVGDPCSRVMAPGADLRTDLPRYHVYAGAERVAEVDNVIDYWSHDLVGFLMGCSFTFEWALVREGVLLHHVLQDRTVPMYRTNLPLVPVGPFRGNLVVSMRAVRFQWYRKVASITARFPRMHGEPVHHGEPGTIGIADLDRPDFGEAIVRPSGTIPIFWACGVTSQAATMQASPSRWICHAPGHMLILDRRHEEFEEVTKR